MRKTKFILLLVILSTSSSLADQRSVTLTEYSGLIQTFSESCFPDGEPELLSVCRQSMSDVIEDYSDEGARKTVQLAASQVMLYYAKETNSTYLYESERTDIEQQFIQDQYANLLSRVYASTLLDQGRYLEAYTLQERSAMVENDAQTHQTAAIMLGKLSETNLRDLQISHLRKAVKLAKNDQQKILFGNQLYRTLVENGRAESADSFKSSFQESVDLNNLAAVYARKLVEDKLHIKEIPPFCQPYSFDLIDEAPCRSLITILETAWSEPDTSNDHTFQIGQYLRSSYLALIEHGTATDHEQSRFNEL